MKTKKPVFLYGAYGHTGRFVLRELQRRGWMVWAAGRDESKLEAAIAGLQDRVLRKTVATTDPDALQEAARGAAAIINCAGPFQDTAWPLIEACLKLKIPYFDVTGEAGVVAKVFSDFAEPARKAGVSVMSGTGFYGALGDLLATAVASDWRAVDSVSIGFALDGWRPTPGTRNVLQRMAGRRMVFRDGKNVELTEPPQFAEREFSAPVGKIQVMVDYPGPEGTLISSHLSVQNVTNYMAVAALKDLRAPDTAGPVAVDETGRSAQNFHMEVEISKDGQPRRGWVSGRDIYAITAPIVVEALERVIADDKVIGVISPGGAFDAADFLDSLKISGLEIQIRPHEDSIDRPARDLASKLATTAPVHISPRDRD